MPRAGRLLCLLSPLVFALLGGCGSAVNPNAPATVSGKVTYNGSPVPGGTLSFHGKDVVYPTPIGPDGSYLGRDFPIGELTVTVDTEALNPERKTAKPYPGKAMAGPDKMAEQFRPPPEGVTATPGTYVKIPAKFKDKTKSGLTVTLKSGSQTHNFELTD